MKQVFSVLILIACAFSAGADVIVAYWDFGPDAAGYTEAVSLENAKGTPTLTGMSTGTGYDSNGQSGVSFIDAVGGSHNAGQALAWASGVNDGNQQWTLNVDLTGYQNLTIRWDHRATSTGPSSADFEYQVASGGWVSIETVNFTQDSSFNEYLKDLSSISAIENQSSVQLRLSNFSGGSGSGTYRLDNLQLSAVPEPTALALIGIGGLLALVSQRLKR